MKKFLKAATAVCAFAVTATPAVSHDSVAGLTRAYYWNTGDSSKLSDSERISHIKSLGVSEVHIWLNGNLKTPNCGYKFRYTDGSLLWKADRLEAFTRALKDASLKPVFIFSPDLRTESYIRSLSVNGGPLEVASKVKGVDIELDIEGNGESATPCPGDGLGRDEADRQLIDLIHTVSPTSKIIMSTTSTWGRKHPVLTSPNGVDAISPQLYGAHFADPITEAERALNSAMKEYPGKQLWVGLSVECSEKDANAGHCSERLFDSEVKMVSKAHTDAPSQVTKYVIWGEREARPCPSLPLCSVFGADYLKRTSKQ